MYVGGVMGETGRGWGGGEGEGEGWRNGVGIRVDGGIRGSCAMATNCLKSAMDPFQELKNKNPVNLIVLK